MEQLRRQVQSIQDSLAAMRVSAPKPKRPAKKRRNRKRARKGLTSVPGTTAVVTKRNQALGPGEMVFRRSELVTSVTVARATASKVGSVEITPDSFSFLKGIATAFERVKWNRLAFYWKPAVGTTVGGLIAMGVDWDWSDPARDRRAVVSYTPSVSHAAWQDTESRPLVLSNSRLQSRNWYSPNAEKFDKGPGILAWAADVSTQSADLLLGEIWVSYEVHFAGTKS